jgi:DNA-binding NtrC family response regulator
MNGRVSSEMRGISGFQDGVAIIMEVRKLFPKLPIIAMSGNPAATNMLGVAEKLGVVGSLQKPFLSADLSSLVERALKRKKV